MPVAVVLWSLGVCGSHQETCTSSIVSLTSKNDETQALWSHDSVLGPRMIRQAPTVFRPQNEFVVLHYSVYCTPWLRSRFIFLLWWPTCSVPNALKHLDSTTLKIGGCRWREFRNIFFECPRLKMLSPSTSHRGYTLWPRTGSISSVTPAMPGAPFHIMP